MSKKEIIKELIKKNPKIGKKNLEKILNFFFEELIANLVIRNSVEIRSWGTFFVKEIDAKKNARNPSTNEIIYVPKRNKLRFRASKRLKEIINK